MIRTIFRISWLNLKRDRLALVLTFLLPILFYSLFAWMFGNMEREGVRPIDTILIVEDDHDFSRRLAQALEDDPLIRPIRPSAFDGAHTHRADADAFLRVGAATAVVILPRGLGDSLGRPPVAGGRRPIIELRIDRAHPIAAHLVTGVLQSNAMRVGHGMIAELPVFESTPAVDPLPLAVVDVLGAEGKQPSTAFFAAGIGVLFLLFAVSGRSAILVEERERGVLKRMLGSQMRLWQLLVGRWLFLALLGGTQVTLMFVWGSIAFDLELWTPQLLLGFSIMTAATAAAAAGFGLLLGSVCRTRAQLNGVATVIILAMSALGGSMFPSFLMPEAVQRFSLVTFNAWALQGYQKVFWYGADAIQLWPQVTVLLTLCAAFLVSSHLAALRWRSE